MNEENIQKNLSQVLNGNDEDITDVWMRRLIENWSDSELLLKLSDIKEVLFPGFRDFISTNKNSLFIMNALYSIANEFKELFENNTATSTTSSSISLIIDNGEQQQEAIEENKRLLFKQLQTAIYYFQDAIDTILKKQNIPPHWIFALDSLIRESVKEAQRLLQLCFKNVFGMDTVETLTVKTTSSVTSTSHHDTMKNLSNLSPAIELVYRQHESSLFNMQMKDYQLNNELRQLIQENNKTVKQLSDTVFEYLAGQNQLLKQLYEKVKSQNVINENINADKNVQNFLNHKNADQKMISMLQEEKINQSTIDAVMNAFLSHTFFYYFKFNFFSFSK